MMESIPKINGYIFAVILIIIFIGTLFVFNIIDIQFRESAKELIMARIISILIGFLALIIAVSIDTKIWKKLSGTLFGLSIISLLMLRIPGVGITANGATRWIGIFGQQFQPSEFAKIALILLLAGYLSKKADETLFSRYLIKEIIAIVIFVILIGTEPDIGNSFVIALTGFAMIYAAGYSLKELTVGFCILAIITGSLISIYPRRIDRIRVVLDPGSQKYGIGNQVYRSIQGISSGGLYGSGFGNSFNKNFFLRESHTDYIFSVYAEETGLIGSISLIVLYIILLFEGFHIAYTTKYKEYFRKYVSYGIVFLLSLQIVINLAVAVNLSPSKGLPLPLFSFGGSSIIATMFMIGILLRVDYENKKE